MSGILKRAIRSFLKQFIPITAVAAMLITPTVTFAESLLLFHNETDSRSVTPEPKRPVRICLNENGDLLIKHSKVELTMAYAPLSIIIDPQEQSRIAQKQDCLTFSGISLKISFLF